MDHVIGRLQELLAPFKKAENANSIKFIKNDLESIQLMRVWQECPALIQEPLAFGGPPMHKPNLWKYVWKFRRIEYRELEKRTGFDRKKIQEKLNLLVTHQLIYPDGSISQHAHSLLQSK
jgi:hypothetical protein